jgi:hypothetical protein
MRIIVGILRRLLREADGTHHLEMAVFAGVVVLVSAIAFSATGGAVHRALERVSGVIAVAAGTLCDATRPSGLPQGDPGWPTDCSTPRTTAR